MPSDCISFKKTGYFSSLICDYLDENKQLQQFYNRFPKLENFKQQIEEKKQSIQSRSLSKIEIQSRIVLYDSLIKQYEKVEISKFTASNIEALKNTNTFTVTTGHQLNIFTGPLYFFYKIISTINLCKELKAKYPENNFVPIYWMATEDHDFEEINYFNFEGKKVQWNRNVSGAVGELNLDGFDEVYKVFSNNLNSSQNSKKLKEFFKNAYLNHSNLADATCYLVNELFKDYGLVILDGNDSALKQLFIPYIKNELLNQTTFKTVTKTNIELSKLNDTYKIQVNPREINLFYLTENLRERIVFEDEKYKVLNSNIVWSKSELLKHLDEMPERFSPNVIMRPLYQEVILPNLCYIGGGGELAYWFQLKDNFEAQNVMFPILLLRNSVLLITTKQKQKLEKLEVSIEDLFLKQTHLEAKIAKNNSAISIDFSKQKKHLQKQFEDLYKLAEQTDKSFLGAVSAQEKKQLNGLSNLEKRLLKAEKKQLKGLLNRITELQNKLFPNASLQERNINFSEFYLEYGEDFIPHLIKNLKPLKGEFLVLEI